MNSWLVRLYPAGWRARYGEEFQAVLDERALSPFDAADILLAALDARLHVRRRADPNDHRKGFLVSLRLGGSAAGLGGLLWIIGIVLSVVDGAGPAEPGLPLFLAGIVALLVGMVGLSSFQARRHPVVVWAAFALPALGALSATFGLVALLLRGDAPVVGSVGGWAFFILGLVATIIGSGVFAVVTYRTGALPRSGAAVLGISSVISMVGFAGTSELGGWVSALFAIGLAAFAVGWSVVGRQAIELDRRSARARPV